METPTKSKTELLREYIDKYPETPISELAARFECSRALVRTVQEKLGVVSTNHMVKRAVRQQGRSKSVGITVSDNFAAIPVGEVPADAEEALLLAWFHDTQVPIKDRLASHSRLTELRQARASAGAGEDLGRRAPKSETEVIRRLADLLEGCGKQLARRAWRDAFTLRPRRGVRRPCPTPDSSGSVEPNDSFDPSFAVEDSRSPEPSDSNSVTSADTPSEARPETSPEPSTPTRIESSSTSESDPERTPSPLCSTSLPTPPAAASPPNMEAPSANSPPPGASAAADSTATPTTAAPSSPGSSGLSSPDSDPTPKVTSE